MVDNPQPIRVRTSVSHGHLRETLVFAHVESVAGCAVGFDFRRDRQLCAGRRIDEVWRTRRLRHIQRGWPTESRRGLEAQQSRPRGR
jgi:hypothetical protein